MNKQRSCRARPTQTIQTAIMPFMSRFLCVIARTLGWPAFRLDGGGTLSTLKESYVLRKSVQTRRIGTTTGIAVAQS